jgi:hypothetical protein
VVDSAGLVGGGGERAAITVAGARCDGEDGGICGWAAEGSVAFHVRARRTGPSILPVRRPSRPVLNPEREEALPSLLRGRSGREVLRLGGSMDDRTRPDEVEEERDDWDSVLNEDVELSSATGSRMDRVRLELRGCRRGRKTVRTGGMAIAWTRSNREQVDSAHC